MRPISLLLLILSILFLSIFLFGCQENQAEKELKQLRDSIYIHINDLPSPNLLTGYQKDSLDAKTNLDNSESFTESFKYLNYKGHTMVCTNIKTSSQTIFHDPECYKCKYSK